MRKLAVLFCAFLIFVTIASFGAAAEVVENHEITLDLAIGERSGTFTGTLENGLPHGQGVFESVTPEGASWRYEGEFANGEPGGDGRIYLNGQISQRGTFREGLLWNGIMYNEDGSAARISEGAVDISNRVMQTLIIIIVTIVLLLLVGILIYRIRVLSKNKKAAAAARAEIE